MQQQADSHGLGTCLCVQCDVFSKLMVNVADAAVGDKNREHADFMPAIWTLIKRTKPPSIRLALASTCMKKAAHHGALPARRVRGERLMSSYAVPDLFN
jgi:hypothetical protein